MPEQDLKFRYAIDMFKPKIWKEMCAKLAKDARVDPFNTMFYSPGMKRGIMSTVSALKDGNGIAINVVPVHYRIPMASYTKTVKKPPEDIIRTFEFGGKIFKYREKVGSGEVNAV